MAQEKSRFFKLPDSKSLDRLIRKNRSALALYIYFVKNLCWDNSTSILIGDETIILKENQLITNKSTLMADVGLTRSGLRRALDRLKAESLIDTFQAQRRVIIGLKVGSQSALQNITFAGNQAQTGQVSGSNQAQTGQVSGSNQAQTGQVSGSNDDLIIIYRNRSRIDQIREISSDERKKIFEVLAQYVFDYYLDYVRPPKEYVKKRNALNNIKAYLKDGNSAEQLKEMAFNYKEECIAQGKPQKFFKGPSNFYGRAGDDKDFCIDYAAHNYKKPNPYEDECDPDDYGDPHRGLKKLN